MPTGQTASTDTDKLSLLCAQLASIPNPCEGTCTWIDGRPEYKLWNAATLASASLMAPLTSPEPKRHNVLGLFSGPGWGKSVLAKRHFLKLVDEGNRAIAVFCRRTSGSHPTPSTVVASLIYLLVNYEAELRDRIPEEFLQYADQEDVKENRSQPVDARKRKPFGQVKTYSDGSDRGLDDFATLWKILAYIVRLMKADKPPIFVIDALDQCDESFRLIDSLLSQDVPIRAKWLITMRETQQWQRLRHEFESTSIVFDPETISQDIKIYLDTEIKATGYHKIRHGDVINALKEALEAGHGGMFLVVSNRLKKFLGSGLGEDGNFDWTPANLRHFLKDSTLTDYYREMLDRVEDVTPERREKAAAILSMLLAAPSGRGAILNNTYLQAAFACSKRKLLHLSEFDFTKNEDKEDFVLFAEQLCGSIVKSYDVEDGAEKPITITHATAYEFLMDQNNQRDVLSTSTNKLDQFLAQVDSKVGHALLARTCLNFMTLSDLPRFNIHNILDNPLLRYSIHYLEVHVKESKEYVHEYKDLLREFLFSDALDQFYFYRIYCLSDLRVPFRKHFTLPVALSLVLFDFVNVINLVSRSETEKKSENKLSLLDKPIDIDEALDGWTPLLVAVQENMPHMVLHLLELGANVSLRIQGCSPLQIAVEENSDIIVSHLIKYGALDHEDDNNSQIDLPLFLSLHLPSSGIFETLLSAKSSLASALNFDKDTILHMAARLGQLNFVQVIVQRGLVDVNRRTACGPDGDDITPLMVAAAGESLKVVKYLLEFGADPNLRSASGQSPLWCAANTGTLEILSFLLPRVEDKNAKYGGWSPLHTATFNGRADIVDALIEAKCDLDSMNDDFNSPLSVAVENGHYSVALQLLSARAKAEFKNKFGQSPLYLACRKSNPESMTDNVKLVKKLLAMGADPYVEVNSMSCLHLAASWGNLDIVRAIVAERAIRSPQSWTIEEIHDPTEFTPLMAAMISKFNNASSNKVKVAKFLFGEKVDVTRVSSQGWTYLHFAVTYMNDASFYTAIKERILNVKPSLLYACTKSGRTALSLAAAKGFVFVVRDLLGMEFDTTFADEEFITPMCQAGRSGSSETVKLLLDHEWYPYTHRATEFKTLRAVAQYCNTIDERLLSPLNLAKEAEQLDEQIAEQDAVSDWKSCNRSLYTPLQLSLQFQKKDNAMKLLRYGSDPKRVTSDGISALHWASQMDDPLLIEELLKRGADKDQLDWSGVPPYIYALDFLHSDVAKLVRPTKGLNCNSRRNLRSIVTAAAYYSLSEVCWCYDTGAVLTTIDVYGQTPLLFAVFNRSVDTVEYILDRMTESSAKMFINLPTILRQLTPANTACLYGQTAIVEKMIAQGRINTKQTDVHGLTVFDLACRHKPTLALIAAAYPKDFLAWARTPEPSNTVRQQSMVDHVCELTKWLLSNEASFWWPNLISAMRFEVFNSLAASLGLLQDTENWTTAIEIYIFGRFDPTPAWAFYCSYCHSHLPKPHLEDDKVHNLVNMCPTCFGMPLCESCVKRTKTENLNGCYQHDVKKIPSKGWFSRSTEKVNDVDGGQSEREWWESMLEKYRVIQDSFLGSKPSLTNIETYFKKAYPDDRRHVFNLCIPNHIESLFDHLSEFPADIWLRDDSDKSISFRLLESSSSDQQASQILERLASYGANLLSYDKSNISIIRIACEADYEQSLTLLLAQFDPEFDDKKDPYASEAVKKMILKQWGSALSFAVHGHFTWLTYGEFEWLKRFPAIGENDENVVEMLLELGPFLEIDLQNLWFPWLPFKQPECNTGPAIGKHFEGCAHMVGQNAPLVQSATVDDELQDKQSQYSTEVKPNFELTGEEGDSVTPSSEDTSSGIWLTNVESFDIAESVFSFVGLGGVFPRGFGDAKLEYPNGPQAEVILSYKIAGSSYDSDFKDGLISVTKGLLQAIHLAQKQELCCDSFTIPHIVPDRLTDGGHRMIQLSEVNVTEVLEFAEKIETATQDSWPSSCRDAAEAALIIFRKFFNMEDSHTDPDSDIDQICLALQFLSLSFAFFLRGYVYKGSIPVVAVPVFKFTLLGISGKYLLQLQPHEMACVGKMLGNTVLAFDRVVPKGEIQRAVDKSCSLFYLRAVVQDIIELWGPAKCLRTKEPSGQAYPTCSALSIRDGFLYLRQGASHEIPMAHWSGEFRDNVSTLVDFSLRDTIIVGIQELHINKSCPYQRDHDVWQEYYRANAFYYIGTTPAHDRVSSRTESITIGGSMFGTASGSLGRARIRDEGKCHKNIVKDAWVRATKINAVDWENVIVKLNEPNGLLWSACTGLAMRVPLRICVSRVFDFYMSDLPNDSADSNNEITWRQFKENLKFALEGDDTATAEQGNRMFKVFWEEHWRTSQHLMRAVRAISTILSSLSHTGWEVGTNRFKIAWPGDENSRAMVAIRCLNRSSKWLRILADTDETATFAVATKDCLVSGVLVGVPFSSRSARTCRGNLRSDVGIAEEDIRLKLLATRVCRASPSYQPVLVDHDQSYDYIFRIEAADAMHLMKCELVKDSSQKVYLRAHNDPINSHVAQAVPALVRMGIAPDTLVYLKEVNGLQGTWKRIGICSSDEWERQQRG